MPLPSPNPSDSLCLAYYDRKIDTQEEYTSLIKTALQNTITMSISWTQPKPERHIGHLCVKQMGRPNILALNTAYE